jgi:hypothetical protein
MGTFQGMMAPTTPSGSRTVTERTLGCEGHAFALQFAAKPAEEFKHIGDNIGFHAAFRAQSLAGFKRNQPAQFIHMFLQQGSALMHQRAALPCRQLGPFLLRLGGIGHRGIHIRRIAFGPRATSMPVAGFTTAKLLPLRAGT